LLKACLMRLIGAPLFYYLAGANPLPDDRMSIIRLVLVHAIFLELVLLGDTAGGRVGLS